MGRRPVHIGLSEAVFAAVGKSCDGRGEFEGAVPIEGCKEAAFASSHGLKQIFIPHVVWLFGNVTFEGKYLRIFIFDASSRLVDVGNPIFAKWIAEDVAIFVVAIEPQVAGREVLVVYEFALDLEKSEVIVLATFLTCL